MQSYVLSQSKMKNRTRMSRLPSRRHALVTLLAFLAFPSLLMYLLPVSSMAPGVILACMSVLIFTRWRVTRFRISTASNGFLMLAVITFVCVHFALAAMLWPIDAPRFAGSLVVLVLAMVTAALLSPLVFGKRIGASSPERIAFAGMALVAIAGIIGIEPPGARAYAKPVFPFTEPSLFALSFLPMLMWVCVTSKGWKRYAFLGGGLAVALLLQNLTLLAGLVLISAICTPLMRALVTTAIVSALFVSLNVDLTYFTDRLNFSAENDNLSTLVYLQGWQMVDESIINSRGLGLGFQQLGVNGTHSAASKIIYGLVGNDLNLLDGGFLFVKLVSEFGVFGLVALAMHLFLAARCAMRLRQVSNGELTLPPGTILALSVVVTYLIEVYVRSAGYLVGTGVLFLGALFHLRNYKFELPEARTTSRKRRGNTQRTAGQ